jgi:hypothetical protein
MQILLRATAALEVIQVGALAGYAAICMAAERKSKRTPVAPVYPLRAPERAGGR